MATSDAFDHAVRNAGKNTSFVDAQLRLIALDFEVRYNESSRIGESWRPGSTRAISDEWNAYLRDIGGYANFLSYVNGLTGMAQRLDEMLDAACPEVARHAAMQRDGGLGVNGEKLTPAECKLALEAAKAHGVAVVVTHGHLTEGANGTLFVGEVDNEHVTLVSKNGARVVALRLQWITGLCTYRKVEPRIGTREERILAG